jgi:hypothetical protein
MRLTGFMIYKARSYAGSGVLLNFTLAVDYKCDRSE